MTPIIWILANEISSLRTAADMVGEIVTAGEEQSTAASTKQQGSVFSSYIVIGEDDDETPPAYEKC